MVNTTLHSTLVPMIVDNISALEFDKDNFPKVEIGGKEYYMSAVRKDMSIHSVDSSALTHDYASRVHIDFLPKLTATLDTDLQARTAAAHVFITGVKADSSALDLAVDAKASEVIIDIDSLCKAAGAKQSPPLCARNISHHSSGKLDADFLKAKYKAYINAINERNMSQSLPVFCRDVVIHNGRSLPLVEYQKLMEDAQAIMPDLVFNIANCVADVDKQLLAVKIAFRGTPIGEFAGVMPLDGVRKEVRFTEMAFYWFQDGKIAQVVSLVDLASYRDQVTGQQ